LTQKKVNSLTYGWVSAFLITEDQLTKCKRAVGWQAQVQSA